MSRTNTLRPASLAVGLAAALYCSTALAGSFALREQSTIGAGMSYAGAGTDNYGLSGMFWNPAAINSATGFEWDSNYTFIAPYATMHAGPGTSPALTGSSNSGNIGIDGLAAAGYGAYRINSDWVVGVAVTAPFGLATKADVPWQGSGLAVTSKAFAVNTDLVVGYRVNDWLSIAAGPSITYAQARFSRDVIPILPGYQSGTLRDLNDWGAGFVVGTTVKPWQGGEFALGYRSVVNLDLKGTLTAAANAPFVNLPVSGKITLPDMLTLGYSQVITPDWTALASVEWKGWSRVQNVPFIVRSGPLAGNVATSIPFRYNDGWDMALGAEYRWNDALTLRSGIAYEISPVDDSNRIPGIPDANRFWVSGGASYKFNDHISVDFGYSHAFTKEGKINQDVVVPIPGVGPVPFPLVAKSKAYVDVVSLGFRYKFGSDAVQPMPEAVVKP